MTECDKEVQGSRPKRWSHLEREATIGVPVSKTERDRQLGEVRVYEERERPN